MNKIIKEETTFNIPQIIEDIYSIIGKDSDKNKINTLLNVLFFDKIQPAIFTKKDPFISSWSKIHRQEAHIIVAKKIFKICEINYPLDYDTAYIVEDMEAYTASDVEFELDEKVELYVRTTIPNITEMMEIFEKEMNIYYTSEISYKLWEYFERLDSNLNNRQFDYQYGGNCNDYIQSPLNDFVALYKGGYGDCGILYITKDIAEIQMY